MRKTRPLKKLVIIFVIVFSLSSLVVIYGFKYIANNPANGFIRNLPDRTELQSTLNSNFNDQNSLTLSAVDYELGSKENQPNTNVYDQLGETYAQLNQSLARVYSQDRRDEFEKIWRDHTTILINYAVSKNNDDQTGQDTARNDLNFLRERLSSFLAVDNESSNRQAVKDSLADYSNNLLSLVESKINQTSQTQAESAGNDKSAELVSRIIEEIYR